MMLPERAIELIKKTAMGLDIYVVDITYKREDGKPVIRALVDKAGGIKMEECASLNRELSEIFDKEDVVLDEGYVLEVSSPGLDRKLVKNEDFVWALGRNLKVTTYGPIEGKNVFIGVLLGLGDESVTVEEDGVSTEIPRDKIASAKLNIDIDWSKK